MDQKPENDPGSSATKPAYKTTEFWMKLLAVALSMLLESNAFPEDDPWQKRILQVSLILGSVGYGAIRTSAKNKAAECAAAVAIAKEASSQLLLVPTKPSEPK